MKSLACFSSDKETAKKTQLLSSAFNHIKSKIIVIASANSQDVIFLA